MAQQEVKNYCPPVDCLTPIPIYEKHAQVMAQGSAHSVVLSVSTLLEVDFSEKESRECFFNANCHVSLASLFCQRIDQFMEEMTKQEAFKQEALQQLHLNCLKLISNILQDKTSVIIMLASLPVQKFNALVTSKKQLLRAIYENQNNILQKLVSPLKLNQIGYTQLLIIERLLKCPLTVDVLNHINSSNLNAIQSYNVIIDNIFALFKQLNSKDDKSEGLFKYNFVTKEARPNLQVSDELLLICQQLLLVLVQLSRYSAYNARITELFNNIRQQLHYPNRQIYQTAVNLFNAILQNKQLKIPFLQCMLSDQQKVQVQHRNKLQYRTNYFTVEKLCELLKKDGQLQDNNLFLQHTSYILAQITELEIGDTALKESGVIAPISLLLSTNNAQHQFAACKIIDGICQKEDEYNRNVEPEAVLVNEGNTNQNIIQDLFQVLQIIRQNLIDQMWAQKHEKGIENPYFQKQLADYAKYVDECKRIGRDNIDPPPTYEYKKPVFDSFSDLDERTAKLGDYGNIISAHLHSLANILTSNTNRKKILKDNDLMECLLFYLGSTNPCVLKWVCQCFANLCENKDMRKKCNTYIFNSEYEQDAEEPGKETAVSLIFSIIFRITAGLNNPDCEESEKLVFNQYITNQILNSALQALIQILDDPKYAEETGLNINMIFNIVQNNILNNTDKLTRGFFIGLCAKLSAIPHNAHILLENNIVDYLIFLSFQFDDQNFFDEMLIEFVCICVSQLIYNAPIKRTQKEARKNKYMSFIQLENADKPQRYYGEDNICVEFGRRGLLANVIKMLGAKQKPQTFKAIIKCLQALSNVALNCIELFKKGVIEQLINIIQDYDEDVQEDCAQCIKTVRVKLQAVMQHSKDIHEGDAGMWGVVE